MEVCEFPIHLFPIWAPLYYNSCVSISSFVPRRSRRRSLLEKQARRRRIMLLCFIVLMVCGFLYAIFALTRLERFTLSHIEIEGGETLSHDELQTLIANHLEGNHYLLIPKRFRYTYPRSDIIALLERNPRIRDVVVEPRSQNVLLISFTEYVPHALLCSSVELTRCFLITQDGYAYEEAPLLTGGTFMRWYDETLETLEIKSTLSIPQWQDLEQFARLLHERYGFLVASIRYSMARDIIFVSHTGAEIRISDTKDRAQSLSDIDAIFTSDEYHHLTTDSFLYVDARFADKVYIKEKETVPLENATTSLHESDES